MADHPLRPATDHRLGEPLPHQLANRPQPPPATALADLSLRLPLESQPHTELPRVSAGYPLPLGRLATCSSPVRHVSPPKGTPFDLHALGTPPALILSQDQTLHQWSAHPTSRFPGTSAQPRRSSRTRPTPPHPPGTPKVPALRGSCHLHCCAVGKSPSRRRSVPRPGRVATPGPRSGPPRLASCRVIWSIAPRCPVPQWRSRPAQVALPRSVPPPRSGHPTSRCPSCFVFRTRPRPETLRVPACQRAVGSFVGLSSRPTKLPSFPRAHE